MVVSPRPSHAFGISVVGHDVVVIGEFLAADRAYTSLLSDLAIQ